MFERNEDALINADPNTNIEKIRNYLASIHSKLAVTQDPDFSPCYIKLTKDLIGYFGILSLAAFVGYGSIWGAATIGTDIALNHGASQGLADAVGVITGSSSFLATTCVNAYYVEKAINRILTKVPYRESHIREVCWVAALAATMPNTILSLKELPNPYLKLLVLIVDTIAGAGLQLEGIKALAGEIQGFTGVHDDNKRLFIKIVTEIHNNMRNWNEVQKENFANALLQSNNMDDIINEFISRIPQQTLKFKRGEQSSRILQFIYLLLWMCTGALATFGNPQAATDGHSSMAAKIALYIAVGLTSIPNAALISVANKRFYSRFFNISSWYANTTEGEKNLDIGIFALSSIIACIASANAMGIAHNALFTWGDPSWLDKIITLSAGASTIGINLSSTEFMMHRLVDAVRKKTDDLDQVMLQLLEIFKRMPQDDSKVILSKNQSFTEYQARFFPPNASEGLTQRRPHHSGEDSTSLPMDNY
jgi:hypothetical protein